MILIALGGNLNSQAGAPARTLDAAVAALANAGVNIQAVSPYYVTPAWPDPSDPPFINAVTRVTTVLPPVELLRLLHDTETAFGRVRSIRNAPRTLDLDLLDYDAKVEAGPPALPHPRLVERAFVLVPLADVAPHWSHPATGQNIQALLNALPPAARTLKRLAV